MTRWATKVRREWGALTGGPVSFSWWMVRAAWRVLFSVVVFGVMGMLYLRPAALTTVADGEGSVFSLVVTVLTTPELVLLLAFVAAVAFVLPFLPDRRPEDY